MMAFIKIEVLLLACLCGMVCLAVGCPTGSTGSPIQITINVNPERRPSTDYEGVKAKISAEEPPQADSEDDEEVATEDEEVATVDEDEATVAEVVDNSEPQVPTSAHGRYDFISATAPTYRVGHEIIITGVPLLQFGSSTKGKFVVSMFEGVNNTEKQAMHFNPRFEGEEVAINWMTDDLSWSDEQQIIDTFPFADKEEFRLSIVLAEDEFIFNVNGKPFAKMDYYRDDLLQLLGGVYISSSDGIYVQVNEFKHVEPIVRKRTSKTKRVRKTKHVEPSAQITSTTATSMTDNEVDHDNLASSDGVTENAIVFVEPSAQVTSTTATSMTDNEVDHDNLASSDEVTDNLIVFEKHSATLLKQIHE